MPQGTIHSRSHGDDGLVFGLVAPLLTEPVAMLGIGYGDEETGFLSLEAIDKLALSDLDDVGAYLAAGYWVAYGIAFGTAIIWVYAAIRARFGSGVKTAVYAGIAVWFLVYGLGGPLVGLVGVSSSIRGLLPVEGMIVGGLVHLPALCLATPLGAWIYREG